jgi:hypothetical protein
MAAAREIALRNAGSLSRFEGNCTTAHNGDNPAQILEALRKIERELLAFGGAPDPELTKMVESIETNFPGGRLVDVRALN